MKTYYLAWTDANGTTHIRTVRTTSMFRACSEARGTEVVRTSRSAAIAASERKEAAMRDELDRLRYEREAGEVAWKHEQSFR